MTRRSAAVTTWSDDGPLSLFKQDGDQRGAFEFRTGLIPMLGTAAGKIYAARLPPNLTSHLIEREWGAVFGGLFCEPGAGIVDFDGLVSAARDARFDGPVVVERSLYAQPHDVSAETAARAHRFFSARGFGG